MSDFYRNLRSPITGGLGFIGSNLAIQLVEGGAEVTISNSMLSGHGANRFNIAVIQNGLRLDIRDVPRSSERVREQRIRFSLTAQVSHMGSMRDPLLDQDVICRGEPSLAECCKLHNPAVKIVIASTRQVYGRPQCLPINERRTVDANGISKQAAETYFGLCQEVSGLQSVILRSTNMCVPRLGLIETGGGIRWMFIRESLRQRQVDVFGTGEQERDFNSVNEVLEVLLVRMTASTSTDRFSTSAPQAIATSST